MREAPKTIDSVRCGLISDVLRVSGRARVRVSGSSMLPCLLPGDTLVVHRQEMNRLAEGDIVLYSRGDRLFAHRLLGRNCEGAPYLITRGDSLAENDPPVFPDEFLGRVTSVLRGKSRIAPPRPTILSRVISALFRQSQILTTLLLWLLHRARRRTEGASCRA